MKLSKSSLIICVAFAATDMAVLAIAIHKVALNKSHRDGVTLLLEEAFARNETARIAFLDAVLASVNDRSGEFSSAADVIADDLGSYSSCASLVARLALDKITGSDQVGEMIEGAVTWRLGNRLEHLSSDINRHAEVYEEALRESTAKLAYELALKGIHPDPESGFAPSDYSAREVAERAGITLAAAGLFGVLDVVEVARRGIIKRMACAISKVAAKIFTRPVQIAAASLTCAVADGPMPVGDVIAVAGGLWTAWEISSTRNEFKNDMRDALRKVLCASWEETRECFEQFADGRMNAYSETQKQMADGAEGRY